ncbi:DUF3168 domain-containing protein [Xanthobacter sp. TB0139]|uniref:DUF3168 domain-containing protein n=1 Tax=Xanthobacter sp. TB0139 TaxID=3459178 RepID=UPI00403989EA
MSAPDEALQRAIYAALMADAAVADLVDGRIYDAVPDGAGFPRITFGDFQVLDDSADCIAGYEVVTTLHVWSRAVGGVEAKRICWAVRQALHEAELDLGVDSALCSLQCGSTRTSRDPDGLTTHGIIDIAALIESQ